MPLIEVTEHQIVSYSTSSGRGHMPTDPHDEAVQARAKEVLKLRQKIKGLVIPVHDARRFFQCKELKVKQVPNPEGLLESFDHKYLFFCSLTGDFVQSFSFFESVFDSCDLLGSSFVGCDLSRCQFIDCNLDGVVFRGCIFEGTKIIHSDNNPTARLIRDVHFGSSCDLSGVVIDNVRFENATFSTKRSLKKTVLRRVQFVNCALEDVDFRGARLDRVEIDSSCVLSNVRVSRDQADDLTRNNPAMREILDAAVAPANELTQRARVSAMAFGVDVPRAGRGVVNLAILSGLLSFCFLIIVALVTDAVPSVVPAFWLPFAVVFGILWILSMASYWPRIAKRWRHALTVEEMLSQSPSR